MTKGGTLYVSGDLYMVRLLIILQHFDSSEAEQRTHLESLRQSDWYGLATHQADAEHPTGWEARIACDPCLEEGTECKPPQSKDEQTVRRDDTDFNICHVCVTRNERSRRLDSDNNVVYEEGGFHPSKCGFEKIRALQSLAKTQRKNEKAKAKRALERDAKAAQSVLTGVGDVSTGGPW